jgi:two-component system chemotaxis response regulator CheY
MPVMDGIQFLKKIKELEDFRDIPVIILTTATTVMQDSMVSRLGAEKVLVKPHNFPQLCEYIREAILER